VHLIERFRPFFIIALSETAQKMDNASTDERWRSSACSRRNRSGPDGGRSEADPDVQHATQLRHRARA